MVIPYLQDHLKRRHLEQERYHVWIDDENEVATFALWNLSGQMVGYQQYRPYGSKSAKNCREDGKYYTYISEGQIGVFGVETLCYKPELLFVCEGVFDICRVHNLGFPGIATLTNDSQHLRSWLKATGRKVIVIPDDDEAGKKLLSIGSYAINLSAYFTGVKEGSRDLGRLTTQQVEYLLK